MENQLVVSPEELYGGINAAAQKTRIRQLLDAYGEAFPVETEPFLFSVPGRTEIGGNHTDHNRGKVIAASIGLDMLAASSPSDDGRVVLLSQGFEKIELSVDALDPVPEERGSSIALVRGVLAGMRREGFRIGGFRAVIDSAIPAGAGLSSSAAFEILVASVLNHLYNSAQISPQRLALIAREAEHTYFGKACGLMDQMTVAMGGFVSIDFKNPESPLVESIPFRFEGSEHTLCIVDTRTGHADMSDEYTSIPSEMSAVAGFFSCKALRQITKADVILNIRALREQFGDRAVLRSMHFFDENKRVERLAYALKKNDVDAFLSNVSKSGNSSAKYLQNSFCTSRPEEQALSLALYTAEKILCCRGACRVHGGGFAGTIQAFVPNDRMIAFVGALDNVFGSGCCRPLTIRTKGAVRISL